MIALESADAMYQRCLDLAFNPTGDLNNEACQRIKRNPATGGGDHVDRSFTNAGLSDFSGVDLQLDWTQSVGQRRRDQPEHVGEHQPRRDHAG